MPKKKYYLVLDTETATMPFVKDFDPVLRKQIAIAKPLVYDIGWVIVDRLGNISKKVNYLVQETFFVPNVFNTAYYAEKRPLYMRALANGSIKPALWNDIIDELVADLALVDISLAYNACFDFKKSIRFTDRYISSLYSDDYNDWERRQKWSITNGDKWQNPTYSNPYFELRGNQYPFADLWALACERLINIDKYRNYCLDNNLLTASKLYFNTSAEICFQYVANQHSFVEEHTALADALIEAEILVKILRKGAVTPYLSNFPFKELGTTWEYVADKKPEYAESLVEQLNRYAETIHHQSYLTQIENIIGYLSQIAE